MSTTADVVKYELMVIISPEIGEDAINQRLTAITKSLKDFGGEIVFEDVWGLRSLAYNIRKQEQGFYAVMDVNLDPTHIKELERMLRLEPEVLRHLLMKLPAVYQPKTAVEMEAEAQKAAEEAQKEKDLKDAKNPRMAPRFVPPPRKFDAPKSAAAASVTPAPAAEKTTQSEAPAAAAPKPTVKKKEESEKELKDIDAKLDSILSNPDLNF